MKRITVVGALLVLLYLAPPVRAQETVDDFMGMPYSVPDSQQARKLTIEATTAVRNQHWDKAVIAVQKVLDHFGKSVVMDGPPQRARFVGVQVWAQRFIRALPPEGIAAYRRHTETEARELVSRAIRNRDRNLLAEVIRRFYLSGVGPSALRASAALDLQEGEPRDAAYYLSRLDRDFPDEVTPGDRAALAFAFAKAGEGARLRKIMTDHRGLRESQELVAVGGKQVTLQTFLDRFEKLLSEPDGEAAVSPGSWPVFGGTPARVAPAPEFREVGPDGWSHSTQFRYKNADSGGRMIFRDSSMPANLLGNHYPINPIVDRGVIYYHNGFTLFAVNLYTGKTVWSFNGNNLRLSDGKTNPGTILAPAVEGNRVFASLEVPAPMPEDGSETFAGQVVIYYIPQRRLFAVSRSTGKLLWGHDDESLAALGLFELENINVSSPPLVIDDTIYVTATRSKQRFSSYVLAVNARDGSLEWMTRICTGQQELNLFGRPIKEVAGSAVSERDGKLYCVSNLGVAAALDRRTGQIEWVKGYPFVRIPFSMQWHTTPERRPTWQNGAPVVTDDAVYFTPTDSRHLVALNREDGSLRFLFDGGDPTYPDDEVYRCFLGIMGEYLYVTGPRLLAIHRKTGKVVWGNAAGRFSQTRGSRYREEAEGRGLVTEDAILVSTDRGIYAFDPQTGSQKFFGAVTRDEPKRSSRSEASGGNLVLAGETLLLARRYTLLAFYSWTDVYQELGERSKQEPDNPALALEMAEVFTQGGRLSEAVDAFHRAEKLAADLPAEEAATIHQAAGRGLYQIHMLEGVRAVQEAKRQAALRQFKAALAAATTPLDQVRALLALADLYRSEGQSVRLKEIYVRMADELGDTVYDFTTLGRVPVGLFALINLTDMATDSDEPLDAVAQLSRIISEYPHREILGSTESQNYARMRISALIAEHGRTIYAREEHKARLLLESASESKSIEDLSEIVRLYPNSQTAPRAAVLLGELLLETESYRKACVTLRQVIADFPESGETAQLTLLLATALEKRGYLMSAKAALTRLQETWPEVEVAYEGRTVRAGYLATQLLKEDRFKSLTVEEQRVTLPLNLLWVSDEGENAYVRLLETTGIVPPSAIDQLLVGTNGVLKAVDSRSQKTIWQRRMNGILSRPLYAQGLLILVNSMEVTALRPEDGEELWRFPLNASIRAVGANPGSVFVLTADFRDPNSLSLRAVAPKTGEIIWQNEFEDQQMFDLLLLTEETVGVAARDPAGVTVFDAGTGRIRFRVKMEPRSLYRDPFLVDGDKVFVVHGNQRFELYDMSTGRRIWESLLPGQRFFRSAIPVPGGIFFTDTHENLLMIDAMDGRIRWSVPPVPDLPLLYQGEAADADRIYVVRKREKDSMHLACARDTRTGEIIWRADLVTAKSTTPIPILTERYILYHLNSYDFAEEAWISQSIFLDKRSGQVAQRLAPEELLGQFTYVYLRNGIFGLNARGLVAVFGKR